MQSFDRRFVVSAGFLLLLATAISSPAQMFTTLHSFAGVDGMDPLAGLVQSTDGNLYGATYLGGVNNNCSSGCGEVFKIKPGGALTTLYSFCSQSYCTDGENPAAALVQGIDGNLYGTTSNGGANGFGTVFKIAPDGALDTIYSFCAQSDCLDGGYPFSSLVQGADGSFYGTTNYGGGGTELGGTVFRITRDGAFTVLYRFCSKSNCADGEAPAAGLVQASDGNLYGTTSSGGANGVGGTVFRITPSGVLTTLYSFCHRGSCIDGEGPLAPLIQGADGSLYGTTYLGGANEAGTVFKITLSGDEAVIYTFCARTACADGQYLYDPVVQGTDGNFYGTTWGGGANDAGTAFRLTPGGNLTTIHSFCSQDSCADGEHPYGGLIQDTNGKVYGTTPTAGANNDGTVFGLSMNLGPFVETEPTSATVGRRVKILGTSLTGATSVTFNGTPATFTVVSPSLITTTVPADATSGTVQVVTPGGTLSSNVPFRVIQ